MSNGKDMMIHLLIVGLIKRTLKMTYKNDSILS